MSPYRHIANDEDSTISSVTLKATRDPSSDRFTTKAFWGLGAKFSLFVLATTLITTLVVSFISTQSTREFIHSQVEQRLPSILNQTADKVELWYEQRFHEISVFSSASTLNDAIYEYTIENNRHDLEEAERYLFYLLNNSPNFSALFVLGNDGQPVVWVGQRIAFPSAQLDSGTITNNISSSTITSSIDSATYIASSPLRNFKEQKLGTLNAVLTLESLKEHLQSNELSTSALMYLIDSNKNFIASNRSIPADHTTKLELPTQPEKPVLNEYKNQGRVFVGSALFLPKINSHLVVEESYTENFAPVETMFFRTLAVNFGIALLFSIGAYRIARSIGRPIEALLEGVQQIADGKTNVLIKETNASDEINMLTRAFNTMTARLHEKTSALQQLSITDGLTGLYNHRFFQSYLSHEVAVAMQQGRELALILCDIDNFKAWNDRIGHRGGDKILEKVAEVLSNHTRETDLVARYGGDEFIVVAPNTKLEDALRLGEELRQVVANMVSVPDSSNARTGVTISVGVATYTEDSKTLFNDADQALYRAKESGRNRVHASGIKTLGKHSLNGPAPV